MKVKPYQETHQRGIVSIENVGLHFGPAVEAAVQDRARDPDQRHEIVDFGVQIAEDGRVWVCLNGAAFLRFSPHANGKMQRDVTP